MTALNILEKVGDTPLISLKLREFSFINLFAKLESYNPTGSVKDRAASYILKRLIHEGTIDRDTTIIESTSGNFGVALSAYCKYLNLKFIAVVDPHISKVNEMLIGANGAKIIKVTEPDAYGGYLINRIAKIKELQCQIKNSYWVNQYENQLNAMAYYNTLGKEMVTEIKKIDYVFLGISSGGTITGVSQRVKKSFPDAQVIAVDIEGSRIFTGHSKKRYIPGIGSSIVPGILKQAQIDDFVLVDEVATIKACYELLEKHNIFAGGSSGSVLAGIKKFFADRQYSSEINVACIFPDRGERYFDTIYNGEWVAKIVEMQRKENLVLQEQV
jgi:N-(2-amino-2-carboxyethyl)-L-glutamate synthase